MVKCIVPGCLMTNYADKYKNKFQKKLEQNIKISLHRLPKDINRRKLWLQNIGLNENIDLQKHASVCSLHFKEKDINRTLDKIVLRENAMPYADPFDNAYSQQDNIKKEHDHLNLSFSFIDCNSDQLSLETSFSSVDLHCTKRIKIENQNDNNYQKDNINKQMLLDEFARDFLASDEKHCIKRLKIENQNDDNHQKDNIDKQMLLDEFARDFLASDEKHCIKRLKIENQNDDNHQKDNIDKQMLLDEFTGDFLASDERSLLIDQFQEDYNAMLNEKIFIDRCTSPINLSENLNLTKIHRSTSVSPRHFQDDKDDTIRYLKSSLEEYKRKSQQTIRCLKRKIKRSKSIVDLETIIGSLKSRLNKNKLDVLKQIGKVE